MSKFKVFIAVLFATVYMFGMPTSAMADSAGEITNDPKASGNPLLDVLTLLGVIYAADKFGDMENESQSFQAAIEPKCEGLRNGAECWKELADRPGCFVWEDNLNVVQTVTWSGECNNGVGDGYGMLVWVDKKIAYEQEATLVNGKRNGYSTSRGSNGDVMDGSYVDGKAHGYWFFSIRDKFEAEGPYVEGKQHGFWKYRYVNNKMEEAEGPYIDGKRNGQWTIRYSNGNVEKGELRGTIRYGQWTIQYPDGRVKRKNFN